MVLTLNQKAKTLEVELAKEKVVCTKDKDGLGLGKRVMEEQLAECSKAREQQRQERQLAEDRLQKVQDLCLPLDKDKFETELRNLWRDSIIPRSLDSLGYNMFHPIGSEMASIRRICDHMPTLMSSKVEELARSLRAGIERVTRENSDLQRQKLEAEQGLRTSQEAKEKVEKEAQAREVKLQAECARQTQLALEEKAVLRKERDNLAKELEEKKREAEQLKMQLAVSNSALDTCIKAKVRQRPLASGCIAGGSGSQADGDVEVGFELFFSFLFFFFFILVLRLASRSRLGCLDSLENFTGFTDVRIEAELGMGISIEKRCRVKTGVGGRVAVRSRVE